MGWTGREGRAPQGRGLRLGPCGLCKDPRGWRSRAARSGWRTWARCCGPAYLPEAFRRHDTPLSAVSPPDASELRVGVPPARRAPVCTRVIGAVGAVAHTLPETHVRVANPSSTRVARGAGASQAARAGWGGASPGSPTGRGRARGPMGRLCAGGGSGSRPGIPVATAVFPAPLSPPPVADPPALGDHS